MVDGRGWKGKANQLLLAGEGQMWFLPCPRGSGLEEENEGGLTVQRGLGGQSLGLFS